MSRYIVQIRCGVRAYFTGGLLMCILADCGCKKLVEVPAPSTSVTANNVYSTDAAAAAVLTGIYQELSESPLASAGGIPSLTVFAGLSSDELTLWNGVTDPMGLAYYGNALLGSANNYGSEFWTTIYPTVFSCNDAIDGLTGATSLTPAVKQQALGEAKFMRAFFYFYLTSLYENVALALSNDYKINAILSQVSMQEAYQQVVADLHDAQKLLSSNYLDATLLQTTTDRTRPTQWAATAMLARTYLYMGNWVGADSAASVLITNSNLFNLSSLVNAFLNASLGNNEAIWQLQPVNVVPSNTTDAYTFIIPPSGPGTGTNYGAYLSNNLMNSFESGDQRRQNWVDSTIVDTFIYYYPYKYKLTEGPVNEYYMVLRLAEQYLIRAEARAHEGNVGGAQADLDSIRARAGLPPTSASTQTDLLTAIMHERQVELFAELGHRWLDLKRTGTIDAIMSQVTPQKEGGAWSSYQQLYPISILDIEADPNLKQNQGYN
jgi:hypothetical protein